MSLVPCTRCIFIMAALSLAICQIESQQRLLSQQLNLGLDTKLNNNHHVFYLTVLGLCLLAVLGCLGCLCCCCRSSKAAATNSLDVYAPRTQSIVWPSLPEETARVQELTFHHTPGIVNCLCPTCWLRRNVVCIDNCVAASEC